MKRFLLKFIALYRRYISPYKGTKCPYIPSCSEYGEEAIRVHGVLTGSMLAAWRVLRCNPLSDGGFDPVPEKSFMENRVKPGAARMVYIDVSERKRTDI